MDVVVAGVFETSGGTYGSPRVHADLVDAGWSLGENTVADSMRRQGLFGRKNQAVSGSRWASRVVLRL